MSTSSLASYNKRKTATRIAFALIVAAVAALFVFPFVSAWTDPAANYNQYKDAIIDELNDGMYDSVEALFGTGDAPVGTGAVNLYFRNIKTKFDESDLFHKVGKAVSALSTILIIIIAFGTLFHELQRGEPTLEMFTKSFLILAVGMIIIINWEYIMGLIEQLGGLIVSLIRKGIDGTEDHGVDGFKELINRKFSLSYTFQDLGSITGILKWVQAAWNNLRGFVDMALKYCGLSLLWCIFEFPLMGARIVLLTILIEINIRKAFFPLAVADICSQGLRSAGMVYIKKMVALWIRIGMCLIIAVLCNLIISGIEAGAASLGDSGTDNFVLMVVRIACVFIAYKTCTKMYANTAGLANQVIGA